MLLSDRQKALIRSSWKLVKERMDGSNAEIGRAIFLRLFELAPETQALFSFRDETREELATSKKLGRHGANFVRNVERSVESMDRLFGELGPKLVSLGARHYGFGAEEAQYAVAGEALLYVLANVLKSDFTAEVKEAWGILYSIISEAMIEGGRDH